MNNSIEVMLSNEISVIVDATCSLSQLEQRNRLNKIRRQTQKEEENRKMQALNRYINTLNNVFFQIGLM